MEMGNLSIGRGRKGNSVNEKLHNRCFRSHLALWPGPNLIRLHPLLPLHGSATGACRLHVSHQARHKWSRWNGAICTCRKQSVLPLSWHSQRLLYTCSLIQRDRFKKEATDWLVGDDWMTSWLKLFIFISTNLLGHNSSTVLIYLQNAYNGGLCFSVCPEWQGVKMAARWAGARE